MLPAVNNIPSGPYSSGQAVTSVGPLNQYPVAVNTVGGGPISPSLGPSPPLQGNNNVSAYPPSYYPCNTPNPNSPTYHQGMNSMNKGAYGSPSSLSLSSLASLQSLPSLSSLSSLSSVSSPYGHNSPNNNHNTIHNNNVNSPSVLSSSLSPSHMSSHMSHMSSHMPSHASSPHISSPRMSGRMSSRHSKGRSGRNSNMSANPPCTTLFLALNNISESELQMYVNQLAGFVDQKITSDSKGHRVAFVDFDTLEHAATGLDVLQHNLHIHVAYSKNPLNRRQTK